MVNPIPALFEDTVDLREHFLPHMLFTCDNFVAMIPAHRRQEVDIPGFREAITRVLEDQAKAARRAEERAKKVHAMQTSTKTTDTPGVLPPNEHPSTDSVPTAPASNDASTRTRHSHSSATNTRKVINPQ